MARTLHKKRESGLATSYISRKQALRKLQISLKDFRRLCIFKGIYPAEPKHKKVVNKNNSSNKTYYFLKDIQFLLHEPVIDKFRQFKIFLKKLKRAIGRRDQEESKRLRENAPSYKLDHIVKERYPSFIDALRDVDDALSMCFLFGTMPKSRHVKAEIILLCKRLTVEFMHYVMETRSLRKVFISIKGFYYQAEVMGQLINWIVPHARGFITPNEVDFKIMRTFTEFYTTMLGFVNFKLFNTLNFVYPPKLAVEISNDKHLTGEEDNSEYFAALNYNLKKAFQTNLDEVQADDFSEFDDEESQAIKQHQEEKLKKLFEGLKIYLNREVPLESLVFIIRSFGGSVSYDKTMFVGATFEESDETITHHVIDRPPSSRQYLNRYYIQPQWVYDCINAQKLLPVEKYFPGEILPPHLSPFVEEKEGDYIPPERLAILEMEDSTVIPPKKTPKKRKLDEELSDTNRLPRVLPGEVINEDPIKEKQKEAAEEKRLALLMMPKKNKHLYKKIIFGQKRKKRENQKLVEKRKSYDNAQKLEIDVDEYI